MSDKGGNRELIDPSEIEEIYLNVLTRVKEVFFGEHASVFTGTSGLDFSGLKEWQPGDPVKRIDWAKSTLTALNPLIVKEFVEERSVDLVIVADASSSVFCGTKDFLPAKVIAKAIAALGFSAVIFQDSVGQVVFNADKYEAEAPKGGRNQVLELISLYGNQNYPKLSLPGENFSEIIAGNLRRTSLIVLISDWLFDDAEKFLKSAADLKSTNDVLVFVVDSSPAFRLPKISDGWIEVADVENGRRRIISAGHLKKIAAEINGRQKEICRRAERYGIEFLLLPEENDAFQSAILELFLQRRSNQTNNR